MGAIAHILHREGEILRRIATLLVLGVIPIMLSACSGGLGSGIQLPTSSAESQNQAPTDNAATTTPPATPLGVNAAFPKADLWGATDGSSDQMSVVIEDVVKVGTAFIDVAYGTGDVCSAHDYLPARWVLDSNGGVHLAYSNNEGIFDWSQIDLPFKALDVAGGFGGLTVLDAEGSAHQVLLNGNSVVSSELIVTTQPVRALASFEHEFDGESFALFQDGSVWWLDGHSFMPEEIRPSNGCGEAHLALPQPFGVTGANRLISSANGDLVGAVLDTGETVIWGREPGCGDAMGPLTLTGAAPLISIAGYAGVTADGDLVEWSADSMAAGNSGMSTQVSPIAGPSGVVAISPSGFFSDSLGQAWFIEMFDGPVALESVGPIGPALEGSGIDIDDPASVPWLVATYEGVLIGTDD